MAVCVRYYALSQTENQKTMARTGRPVEGKTSKLAPLNMRTSPELRAKIEEAADVNGRSLTQEVERRLMTSFIFDEVRGGPHIGAFANMLAATIQTIEQRLGAQWIDDIAAHAAVSAATSRLLDWNRPSVEPKIDRALFAQAKATRDDAQALDAQLAAMREAFGWQRPASYVDGLINAGSLAAIDPRANWTPEQRAEEATLANAADAARQEATTAHDALLAKADPVLIEMQEATNLGASIAEATFADLGPRGK